MRRFDDGREGFLLLCGVEETARLAGPELSVEAALGEEVCVGAVLDDVPGVAKTLPKSRRRSAAP